MVLVKVGQFMTQEGRRGAQNTILRLDKLFGNYNDKNNELSDLLIKDIY